MNIPKVVVVNTSEIVYAEYNSHREWVRDPRGYFLVRVNHEHNCVELGFCEYTESQKQRKFSNEHHITKVIRGTDAEALVNTALRLGLISALQHAGYIGSEARKAEVALRLGLPYTQDEELDFSHVKLRK